MEGFTIQHLLKLNPVVVKKYMYFLQEALPFRLKGFHYVNAVSFMDKVLAIVKPFMKKELLDMLYIHTGNNESLYKFLPKDCLPADIGGNCGDSIQIHENYMKKVRDNASYFAAEEKLVVDESKRQGKPRDANELFGVEGTFKKLDID